MKHNYAVVGLLLAVVVLTRFVVNAQQAPTRWEYGELSITSGNVAGTVETVIFWDNPGVISVAQEGGENGWRAVMEDMGNQLGCVLAGTATLLSCLGSDEWELVTLFVVTLPPAGWTNTYVLKRPAR